MGPVFYDKQGQVIDTDEYLRLRAPDSEYYRIASTMVTSLKDPQVVYHVSTVWLGIDHSFGLYGTAHTPILFETMIFGDSWNDEYCDRYATERAAIRGHREAVRTAVARTGSYALVQHVAGDSSYLDRDERR